MKTLRLIFVLFFIGSITQVLAWEGMEMPRLHVEGRYLKDSHGNIINLHGFAQTYSPWFNEKGTKWTNYNVSGCLTYNKGIIDKILKAGWKMNYMRLHMDPYWSNTPGCTPNGHELPNCFNETRFKKYLDEVFIPMAEYAISKGLYVVMRPPGVSPEVIGVDDEYHYAQYLMKVWDIVSKHPRIKNRHEIMFELANEPVRIRLADGTDGSNTQAHFDVLKAIFQPIVNRIRENGFKNVLWIPGSGYQSQYKGYAVNPIEGENIGYAIHIYPGWFGSANGYTVFKKEWDDNIKAIADFSPILVTEMDWAPEKYNASWGKGITGTAGGDGFGANFKKIVDETGNVGWLLFTSPELLAQFTGIPPAEGQPYTFLNDPEACPWPVFHWFKEYADIYWPRPDFTYRSISDNGNGTFKNPVINGNFPAPALLKDSDNYFLFSINSKFTPDTTLLESKDLVNWKYSNQKIQNLPLETVKFINDTNIHSGSYVQTNTGEWWAMVSYHKGPFGNFPHLLPVTWQGGKPVLMDSLINASNIPKPNMGKSYFTEALATNDNFRHWILGPQWGWKGTIDSSKWSLMERAGYMRLRTADVTDSVHKSKNILSQRILVYPNDMSNSYATIKLQIDSMREGDLAGLSVFKDTFSFVGIQKISSEIKLVTFIQNVLQVGPTVNDSIIYLRAVANFSLGNAGFYYSLNNDTFVKIGSDIILENDSADLYSGSRFGIFNFATAETGGFVDIDWFSTESKFSESAFYPATFEGYTRESLTLSDLMIEGGQKITLLTKSTKNLKLKAVFADGHIEYVQSVAEYNIQNPDIISINRGIIRSFTDGGSSLTITYIGPLGEQRQLSANVFSTTFPLTKDLFNPSIWETGTFNETTKTLKTGQWGFGGWQYDGIDISGYKYVVARLGSNNNASVDFRLFDGSSYWGSPATYSFGSKREVVVVLEYAKRGDGTFLNSKHIYIAGFWSNGSNPFIIDTVFLSNSSVYDPPVVLINGKGGVETFSLTGFNYKTGLGPSASQSFTVAANLLTNNVTVSVSSAFEVSLTEGQGYASSVTLNQTSGKVAETPIYVRMKSGLTNSTYSGTILASSLGAYTRTITLSGTISPSTGIESLSNQSVTVVSSTYYSLTGQEVKNKETLNGIYLVKEKLSDGTLRISKVFIKQ